MELLIGDLRSEDRDLLLEVLLKRSPGLAHLATELDHAITEAESEAFTNAVGDEFVDTGMDTDYQVTERGWRLEHLLGRVNSVRVGQGPPP